MKHIFHSSQWQWYELNLNDGNIEEKVPNTDTICKEWLKNLSKDQTNAIDMDTGTEGKEAFWGSLVYVQSAKEEEDKSVFHFYLTREQLITVDIDFLKLDHVNVKAMREKMHEAQNPIEGFLVLVSHITSHFLKKIDAFELELHDLFWKIKKRNNIKILDQVARADQELLIWKNLIVPAMEIRMALKEAFGEEVTGGKQYKLAKNRLERAMFLVRAYEEEIDSLLDFESLVSAHRGNEITKTLTVITTLFAPATVLGAVWGMNFKHMPELEWKLGYLFAGGLMVISTLAIYCYLRRKGWMGDILSTKSKKSFFQ
ncbi:magnesium transporter CorA family protein [Domibacillus sp. PGB-M46]|uniref:magnesium transporter CorA family protein n=1 Tax=Domibacillus sp. PGB-M46 TaxID=2910255 RepID=UPI001F55FD75|nr:magnesium transporter CorA family protein [Domibacillus sp. PGB-M46]MCI2256223.1 magnesium transporter CorA family protein [Domibacillus sp. PGB-M46]